jgi:aminoglycoside phosphotransferase (APT) family kinase protein
MKSNSDKMKEMLTQHLRIAESHMKASSTDQHDFIVQSDLNPLNVLWDTDGTLTGIVDIESIGYTDRIEGLAWFLKWYTRVDGIGSEKISSPLASTFIDTYTAGSSFDYNEYKRLRSLLWLSGCMNWNFVKKTIEVIDTGDATLLFEHLENYKRRGDQLVGLIG